MNRRLVLALIALGPALLSGCGEPVPQARLDYVGEWHGPDMRLLIQPDGLIAYERVRDGNRVSVNAPLQRFDGDDFIAGVGLFNTRFVVSKAPYRDGDAWKMVVDGVELRRVRAFDRAVEGTWT